jgi:hypothetical protein
VGKPLALGAGLWVDLVRVPPSGTWERRRADLFGLAEDWIGPSPALSPEEAAEHLVHRYLHAFGPATPWDGEVPPEVREEADRLAAFVS